MFQIITFICEFVLFFGAIIVMCALLAEVVDEN